MVVAKQSNFIGQGCSSSKPCFCCGDTCCSALTSFLSQTSPPLASRYTSKNKNTNWVAVWRVPDWIASYTQLANTMISCNRGLQRWHSKSGMLNIPHTQFDSKVETDICSEFVFTLIFPGQIADIRLKFLDPQILSGPIFFKTIVQFGRLVGVQIDYIPRWSSLGDVSFNGLRLGFCVTQWRKFKMRLHLLRVSKCGSLRAQKVNWNSTMFTLGITVFS